MQSFTRAAAIFATSLLMASVLSAGGAAAASSPASAPAVTRLAGADRFETSALVSADSFEPGVAVAYVTNGLKFPDALSGAAAAGYLGGPVLLTKVDSLPNSVATELDRLNPQRIVVLGDASSVSTSVESQLRSYSGTVDRTAGSDRWKTSALISATSFAPGVPVAFIATGVQFPDALSGAAAAGVQGGPVLLVPGTSIPASIGTELDRLNPQKIVVLGGEPSVSAAVSDQLQAFTEGSVERVSGSNRFATSAAISHSNFSAAVPVAFIANGRGFPDALSAAPAGASQGGPVLLVENGSIPPEVATELARLRPARIVILGGPGSVSTALDEALEQYLPGSAEEVCGNVEEDVTWSGTITITCPVFISQQAHLTLMSDTDVHVQEDAWLQVGGPLAIVPGATGVAVSGPGVESSPFDRYHVFISAEADIRGVTFTDLTAAFVGNLSVRDSTFVDSSVSYSGDGEFSGNQFRGSPLYFGSSDLSIGKFHGDDANTFQGTLAERTVTLNGYVSSDLVLSPAFGARYSGYLDVTGGHLQVLPGTVFFNATIDGGGTVDVEGTEADPVTFTGSAVHSEAHAQVSLGGDVTIAYARFLNSKVPAIEAVTYSANLSVTDSYFEAPVVVQLNEGKPIFERNVFSEELLPDPSLGEEGRPAIPFKIRSYDLTGIVLDGGPDSNVFEGDGGQVIEFSGFSGPEESEWTLSSDVGATYAGYLGVMGTLNLAPGTVLKNASVHVDDSGKLLAAGTAQRPIVWTDASDLSVGADITQWRDYPQYETDGVNDPAWLELAGLRPYTTRQAGQKSSVSFTEFKNAHFAIRADQHVELDVSHSKFSDVNFAIVVRPLSTIPSYPTGSPVAGLPCLPPFTSVVSVTDTWFGDSGKAAITTSPSALAAAFGSGPLPAGYPEGVLTSAQRAALQTHWDDMVSVPSALTEVAQGTPGASFVPTGSYSCATGGGTISFPWLPVRISAASAPPF